MLPEKMNSTEKRASWSLASIMSLRMIGLFMVLPLFSLYAHQLAGATPFLIGIALGVYGLIQAVLQIPFGILSDRIGRRKVITAGLLLFGLGSMVAALSHSIIWMIIGRALQGAGAVGSTIMALIADLTRPAQRTKAMAIAGMSIGASFTLAMMLGPLFASWLSVTGLFWLAAGMSVLGIILLFTMVPTPSTLQHETDVTLTQLDSALHHRSLVGLYLSIFFLHAIFIATFVVVPISLNQLHGFSSQQQWYLYLPTMILAFLFSILMIIHAEKTYRIKLYFLGAIIILGLAELGWWLAAKNLFLSAFSLLLFFTAFSLLEAFLPSLISKAAPPAKKGAALGIYSCAQFLGVFVGGTVGGWLYGRWSINVVYLFCVILALVWVTIIFNLKTGGYHHGERR